MFISKIELRVRFFSPKIQCPELYLNKVVLFLVLFLLF